MELECAVEAEAITAARAALQARIDLRPVFTGEAQRGTAGLGAGSLLESVLKFTDAHFFG
jgi:hypothetical protein